MARGILSPVFIWEVLFVRCETRLKAPLRLPPTQDESLTSKKHNEAMGRRRKKSEMKLIFDFCLLFFVRFCSLLTHEISRAAHQLGIYVFTTKTIMDPLIGFLDCVLVSQCCFYVFFFFAPARPDTFEASVCCWWSFSFRRFIVDRRGTQKWGMFDDFDLQIKAPFCVVSLFSFLAFCGFSSYSGSFS